MLGGIMMGIIEVFATNINADLGFGVAYLVLILNLAGEACRIVWKISDRESVGG